MIPKAKMLTNGIYINIKFIHDIYKRVRIVIILVTISNNKRICVLLLLLMIIKY